MFFNSFRKKIGLTRLNLFRLKIKIRILFNRFCYLEKKENPQLIVSITTFPERFGDVFYSIFSIFEQNLLPDKIILWLSKEEFDEEHFKGYIYLNILKKHGLEIRFCEHIRSFKKYIPSLRVFPNSWIATADDDVYYEKKWLEMLYKEACNDDSLLHCHSGHLMKIVDNKLDKYISWPDTMTGESIIGFDVFPITVAGVIMKFDLLYKDVLDCSIFGKIVPKNDDIWLWAQCVLNGTKIHIIKDNIWNFMDMGVDRSWPKLFNSNGLTDNDIQMESIIQYYPQLKDKIGLK